MAIEDLKRWHWVVIGLIVGLGLGFAQTLAGNDPAADLPSVGPQEFEEELRAAPRDGAPVLDNVVVYPGPKDEPDLVVMDRRTDWGLFARLRSASEGQAGKKANPLEVHYVQHRIYVRKPFKPLVPVPSVTRGPAYTVRDYLRDLEKSGAAPNLKSRYAWWKEPKTLVALWTAGTVVLVGVVWPTVLNLLIGAGFGRSKAHDPAYDLDRFPSGPEAGQPAAAPPPDAAAVEDHVRRLEEELAKGLLPGVPGAGADRPPEPPKPPATLVTAPVESSGPGAADEAKEYEGEFYPVVKPHHSADDKAGGQH